MGKELEKEREQKREKEGKRTTSQPNVGNGLVAIQNNVCS